MIAARLAASLVACSALLAGTASERALALSYEPPDGTAYSGVFSAAGLDRFQSFLNVSGQPSVALFSYTAKYPNGFSYPLKLVAERPTQAHLTWRLFNFDAGYDPGVIAGTTGRIARGDIDRYILDRAAELRTWQRPVQLRINHEMNGTWYPWSIRGRDGKLRPDNGHAEYIASWRRAVTLFRGGTRAEINSKLSALGLPGLTTSGDYFAPVTNVAFVWCASDGGLDDPHPYYPGDDWVDWVGIDIYSKGTEDPNGASGSLTSFSTQIARRAQSIYDRYSGPGSTGRKPYLIGEWGMWNEDNPQWMASMFDWAESRPKVKALLYFNRNASAAHELEQFPKAAQVFRTRIASSRYLKRAADVKAYPESSAPAPAPAPEPAPEPAPAPSTDTTGPSISLSSPVPGQTVSGVVATDGSGEGTPPLGTRPLRGKRPGGSAPAITLSAGQLVINQRISQAALRRVNALEAELEGRRAPAWTPSARPARVALTAVQLRINQRISQAALRRVNALAARVSGTPAPPPAAGAKRGTIALSPGQLQINQRISQAAIRRVAALEELVRAA